MNNSGNKMDIETLWPETVARFEQKFGKGLQLETILFLLGVQITGQGVRRYEKAEKMDLMHVAVCELLVPYGYYTFTHRDADGWPHYEKADNTPSLSQKEQENLMKEAIITYSYKVLPFEP